MEIGIVISVCVAAAFGQPGVCARGYLPITFDSVPLCEAAREIMVAAYERRMVPGARLVDNGHCAVIHPEEE